MLTAVATAHGRGAVRRLCDEKLKRSSPTVVASFAERRWQGFGSGHLCMYCVCCRVYVFMCVRELTFRLNLGAPRSWLFRQPERAGARPMTRSFRFGAVVAQVVFRWALSHISMRSLRLRAMNHSNL